MKTLELSIAPFIKTYTLMFSDLPPAGYFTSPAGLDFINTLVVCVNRHDIGVLREYFSDIEETTLRCVLNAMLYSTSLHRYVNKGDIVLISSDGDFVTLRFSPHSHEESVEQRLNDIVREAVLSGISSKHIVSIVKNIEERIWHG